MADVTTVIITYGRLQAKLDIIYRWYVSGEDPWECTKGMHIIPSGGDWYQHKTGTMNLHNGKGDSSMDLFKFDRKKLGGRGKGTFHGFDAVYNIPKYADIYWEIIGYD